MAHYRSGSSHTIIPSRYHQLYFSEPEPAGHLGRPSSTAIHEAEKDKSGRCEGGLKDHGIAGSRESRGYDYGDTKDSLWTEGEGTQIPLGLRKMCGGNGGDDHDLGENGQREGGKIEGDDGDESEGDIGKEEVGHEEEKPRDALPRFHLDFADTPK